VVDGRPMLESTSEKKKSKKRNPIEINAKKNCENLKKKKEQDD
jgi:hypothetical protein